MSILYAGIGSREVPSNISNIMTILAKHLRPNHILRSGGARGSDTAFENGANCKHEIFLPVPKFNNHRIEYDLSENFVTSNISDEAYLLSSDIWNKRYKDGNVNYPLSKDRNNFAVKAMARNCHQILGRNLDSPVKFVMCYTPNGELVGGTAHALYLANELNIPVYNLGKLQTLWNVIDKLKQHGYNI